MTPRTPLHALLRSGALALCAAGAVTAALAFVSGYRTDASADRAPTEARPAQEAPAAPAAISPRDQYELAREIGAVESLPADEQTAQYGEIRARWLGKRYRWKVIRLAATCSRAERCTVLPFDRNGADRQIMQGWLPRLDMSQEAYARIAARCEGVNQCPIEFEGTLSELVLSTEHLTRLAFRDVAIAGRP